MPDPYIAFRIADPKPRLIHKASVRDRVLYQGVFRQLYPVFEKIFIHDSYASQTGKGVLAGVLRLEQFVRRASRNYSRSVFILKCNIRKFFDSIDHDILFDLLKRKIRDADLLWLLGRVISSFEKTEGKGLPLGNVTSQLFANVYLNELDQFAKRELEAPYYIRYCDDFVIVGEDPDGLHALIPRISTFLEEQLHVSLHHRKVSIRRLEQGVDFLGYVTLPRFRVLRTRTKRRMFKRCKLVFRKRTTDMEEAYADRVLSSYKGLLSHSREYRSWKRLEKLHSP
ncbi:MAG: group II intron reverse transcriptase domain-containing protein [Parcubacteria group bacterium]|nr:group II intron reverse transcriptase domain-containing protein [Parcubacteria group bacterium]